MTAPHPTAEAARIAEIEARLEKAHVAACSVERRDESDGGISYELWCQPDGTGSLDRVVVFDAREALSQKYLRTRATFYAHVPDDIPWLISHLRTAWAERDAARARIVELEGENKVLKWSPPKDWDGKEIARLRADLDRVRKETVDEVIERLEIIAESYKKDAAKWEVSAPTRECRPILVRANQAVTTAKLCISSIRALTEKAPNDE
jgi:hypothetical protein